MKHFFRFFSFSLLLILLNSSLVAQIVNIPSGVFKSKLIALGVDTNGDNNIQVSEALSVTNLNVSNTSNISSMVGIEAFTNLDTLRCSHLALNALNISTLTNLRYLDCGSYNLSSLDVSTCTNLSYLDCSLSNLYNLNVNGCINLNYLDCHNDPPNGTGTTNLNSLDVSSCINLTYLDCHGTSAISYTNHLANLNISGCTLLQYLNCANQQLTSLDLSNCLDLVFLDCGRNDISVIDLSNHINLSVLKCKSNDASLNVSNCPSLSYVECYYNMIDSLDLSNRPNLSYLDCRMQGNGGISYLNIGGCTALVYINCRYNSLTSLDVSNMPNLETLICDTGNISQFNISNSYSLVKLDCDDNQITGNLNLANFTNLDSVNCFGNQITNLDVSNCANLRYLKCSYNQITNLDASNCTNLIHLDCQSNPFSSVKALNCSSLLSLDVHGCGLDSLVVTNCSSLVTLNCYNTSLKELYLGTCTNLQSIGCYSALLDTLDIFNGPSLTYLDCRYNHLKSLDLSNCVNLVGLNCVNSSLVSLDISNTGFTSFSYTLNNAIHTLQYLNASNCSNLTSLTCDKGQLTTLNVGNCTNLESLNCRYNALTSLDVSTCPNLKDIYAGSNNLHTVFLKNGSHESSVELGGPTLLYVCGDANDIADLKQYVAQILGIPNAVVTAFCSYGLGGEYNTITGNAFYDSDANGCTSQDIAYPYFAIKVKKGLDSAISYTNTAGLYNVYTDSGNYSLEPILQNPNYFTSNPTNTNINFPILDTTQTQDFCITANATFPDVEIACINISGQPRPGFDTQYKLLIANKGTSTASGNIIFDFMGNKMTLVSTSLPPSQQTSNQLTWAYSNLLPFETRTIDIKMNILPPPTNGIGDSLHTFAHISLINDADTSNNLFGLNELLVGAYDPNDKTCLEGEIISPTQIGDYLHYLIRFQNTGTFYAENVVVVDTLDATKFDLSSVQVLESSHPTHIDLIKNTLQFYFEGIMLPDSFSNEPASHGYVFFKIKTKNTLATNTTVQNKAEIYFDFNPPVITNTATSTFTNTVGITPSVSRNNLQFYPNPAHTTLTIQVAKASSVSLFNAIGEIIKEEPVQTKSIWDISSLPSGIYMIKADSNTKGQIFIKE